MLVGRWAAPAVLAPWSASRPALDRRWVECHSCFNKQNWLKEELMVRRPTKEDKFSFGLWTVCVVADDPDG